MILFEKAYKIVVESATELGIEKIKLTSALNRVLAENVKSDMDMPPFDKSAMDGYACRQIDIDNELEVIEIIGAGQNPQKTIGKNQCAKIMTGAMVPQGADCVIKVEDTKKADNNKISYIYSPKNINTCKPETKGISNLNICYKGEDINTDAMVLQKGTLLKAQHIAVLASVGCDKPKVFRKPKVAVIATGSELVEPSQKPSKTQIRNSNGIQIITQLQTINVDFEYLGIAKDSEQDTYEMISKAIENNDVLILSGGVSMGDYDYVPDILKKAGFDLLFQTIAVQPGKPTVFGVGNNTFCFGLPGNPVSSFTQFELLAKPLLLKLMGHDYKPLKIKMPMAVEYTRRKAKRLSWLPVNITNEGEVKPVEYHGSAHINGLSIADGIISINIGETKLKKGELVDVRQI